MSSLKLFRMKYPFSAKWSKPGKYFPISLPPEIICVRLSLFGNYFAKWRLGISIPDVQRGETDIQLSNCRVFMLNEDFSTWDFSYEDGVEVVPPAT